MNKENCVLLCGNIAFEPEVKELRNDNRLGKVRLECTSSRGKVYIDVDIWNTSLIDSLKDFSKGDRVQVIGELRSNVWTTQAGEKRSKHVIVPDQFRMADENSDVAL